MKQKTISLIASLLVLAVFYILNPNARDMTSFKNNYAKNNAIDSCIKNATTTSKVLHVTDGDTVQVLTPECGVENVRMIGINTPESVDPRRPVECFGKEASDHAKEILTAKEIILKGDTTQDPRDKYGRILAYVFLIDGTFFNKQMIQDGYAYEYTYNTPYQYQNEFRAAQSEAELNQKGLWSPSTCNGNKTILKML